MLQDEVDQARTALKEREVEERRLCLNVEQLETDLRSSKALTESLQTDLNEKERREVELLGEKEQAVTQVTTLLFSYFIYFYIVSYKIIYKFLMISPHRPQMRLGRRRTAEHKKPRMNWSRGKESCGTWKKNYGRQRKRATTEKPDWTLS